MSACRRLLLLFVSLVCCGCGDLLPDVGPVQNAPCQSADTRPDVAVSFSRDIVPILAPCLDCHDPASPNPIGVSIGGLELTSLEGLREGGSRSSGTIVIPGAPCDSVLYQKLLPGPPFGARMPLTGPFLTPLQLDLVHDWIAEGALDN